MLEKFQNFSSSQIAATVPFRSDTCCAVLCCAVLCCAVLSCAARSCSVLSCFVLFCSVLFRWHRGAMLFLLCYVMLC